MECNDALVLFFFFFTSFKSMTTIPICKLRCVIPNQCWATTTAMPLVVIIGDGVEIWVAYEGFLSHYFNTCAKTTPSLNPRWRYWLGSARPFVLLLLLRTVTTWEFIISVCGLSPPPPGTWFIFICLTCLTPLLKKGDQSQERERERERERGEREREKHTH